MRRIRVALVGAAVVCMVSISTQIAFASRVNGLGDNNCPGGPVASATQHRQADGKAVELVAAADLKCPSPPASGHVPRGKDAGLHRPTVPLLKEGDPCAPIPYWSAIDLSAPGTVPRAGATPSTTPEGVAIRGYGDRVATFSIPPAGLVPDAEVAPALNPMWTFFKSLLEGGVNPTVGDAIAVPDHASILDHPEQSIQRISGVTGLNAAYIRFVNTGSHYSISKQQCAGGSWDLQTANSCTDGASPGLPGLTGDPSTFEYSNLCMYVVADTVRPVGPGPVMPARIKPYLDANAVKAYKRPGTIASAPNRVAYVNNDACWWIEGADTATKSYGFSLEGPEDANGRSLIYEYRLTLAPAGVVWHFSSDADQLSGDAGQPWSAATPGACSNARTYDTISTLDHPSAVPCPAGYPHPTADDGCYRVWAEEKFAATLEVFWYDSDGTSHAVKDITNQVPELAQPIVLKPDPVYVRVLQIEGVPVAR
ncbi:MAG: hypothetical protein M3010_05280 [Candidatus Dormibacteraeota bacterium]|nr:hypothetical protein [Candidatus Dormibacteraeota bacterium]